MTTKRTKQTRQKGFSAVIVLVLVLVIAVIGFAGWKIFLQEDKKTLVETPKQSTQISNFEECAAAGNPIMETYPEQCMADGKTYTKGH
jgi:Tfp pilus assembly protein PilX